jgi:hypothetical protein
MLTLCCAANPDSSPRGPCLATAMTSAAFLPHCEQRIRWASSSTVVSQPSRAALRQGWYWSSLVNAAAFLHKRQPESTVLATRIPNGGELYEHSEWRKRVHVEFAPAQG